MQRGLERVSIGKFARERPRTLRERGAHDAYLKVIKHAKVLKTSLGIDSDKPFRVSQESIEARHRYLEWAKGSYHETGRDAHQLSMLVTGLGLQAVKQMEDECTRQDVLDIGCGEGRFGEALARKVKSRVTFLDLDEEVMKNIVPSSRKTKVVGDGKALNFKNETFDKTFNAFSSIYWAENPLDAVQALNEALRVTKPGGTLFVIPVFSGLKIRHYIFNNGISADNLKPEEPELFLDPLTYKMWDLQDFVILQALLNLEKRNHCSITWGGYLLEGENLGETLEYYSAIVDINHSIPPEVLEENIAYAAQFFENV